MEKKRINTLTSIRFLMIIAIVISHFEFLNSKFYLAHFHNTGVAVSFFFMLSGFGLTYSLNHNDKKKASILDEHWTLRKCYQYARNKMGKLWRWYLLTMIVMIPYSFIETLKNHSLFITTALTAFKAFISYFYLQSAFGLARFTHAFNSVCWFVSCLFLLYMVFPFLYRFINKRQSIKLWMLIMFICKIVALVIFSALDAYLGRLSPSQSFFSYVTPYVRIYDFMIGMLFSQYFMKTQEKQNKSVSTNLAEIVITIVALFWYFEEYATFTGLPYYVVSSIDYLISFLILMIFAKEAGMISKLLLNKHLIILGNLTMYIYLFHYPVRVYVGELIRYLPFSTGMNSVLIILMILVITMICVLFARSYDQKHIRA